MTFVELESLADRKLRALAEPNAPASLLPRILDGIERAGRRPWYRRAWRSWPPAWQAASVAATTAMAWGAGTGLERAEAQISPMIRAAGVLWRLVLEPNAAYLAILACLMAVAAAAYCAAIACLLSEGATRR